MALVSVGRSGLIDAIAAPLVGRLDLELVYLRQATIKAVSCSQFYQRLVLVDPSLHSLLGQESGSWK
jgi:hypothetical protein